MTKKKYNMVFDEQSMELVKAWIKPKGITLSGYFNSLLSEQVKAIKILDGVNDLKDLTIGKLTELYAGAVEDLTKRVKKKK